MALTLTKNALSVTFPRGRIFPTTTGYRINQVLEESEDLTPQATELGGTLTEYQVELLGVDTTLEASFRTFFEDASVRWALNTITLTLEDATTFTGRWWGPLSHQPTQYTAGLFRISFFFRVEI